MPKAKKYTSRRYNKKGGEKTPTDSQESFGLRQRKIVKAKIDHTFNPFPQSKPTINYEDESKKVKAKMAESIQFPDTGKPDIFQQAKEAREEDESWQRAMEGDNMEPWKFDKGGRKTRRHRRKGRKTRRHRKSRKH